MANKKVGLVLGGGAARGLAHVGVIEVLNREGIPIDLIAGTSAGALVGAAYAAGLRGQRLIDLALQARWRHVARPRLWPYNGLVSFAPLESYLIGLIGDCRFSDLEIPFAAVATDLDSGRPVVLDSGRVAPAVRASCSVPGFVVPVELEGRLLADGGISNNLPISVARAMGADVVVAVRLISPGSRRPRGLLQIAVASLEYLLSHAGDDPDRADVCITLPMFGLKTLLSLASGPASLALGRQMAEQAVPALKLLLA